MPSFNSFFIIWISIGILILSSSIILSRHYLLRMISEYGLIKFTLGMFSITILWPIIILMIIEMKKSH